jgi:hypothetical protein
VATVTRSRSVTGLGKIEDGIWGLFAVGYGPVPEARYITGAVGSSSIAGILHLTTCGDGRGLTVGSKVHNTDLMEWMGWNGREGNGMELCSTQLV